ncbi:MAG: hypothetical protein K6E20_06625 [Acholeplasmatales bacterium]|nr:hypothetical protein [Acholeplasmatales bacterium]
MADNKISVDKLEEIKEKITLLKNTNSIIHVSLNKKRKNVKLAKANITGIYPKFISVTSDVNGYEEDFSIMFIDIIMGNVIIEELK